MTTPAADRDAVLTEARQIVDGAKAAGRDLDGAEVQRLNEKVAEIKKLNERIKLAESGNAALKAFGEMPGGPGALHRKGDGTMSAAPGAPEYLDLGPVGRKSFAGQIADRMVTTDAYGRKSLLGSGETVLSVPITPADPIREAEQPLSLLGLLPVQKISAGARSQFIRQSVRTFAAAAVAPGGTKPVSQLGLEAKDVRLRVYAHLSENVDKFLVEDAPTLATFLTNELIYGLSKAVEQDVISGDPAGANAEVITGLLKTSGITSQVFVTDLLSSLRAALTVAEGLGFVDSMVFALSATDWAAAEQARAVGGGTYDVGTAPLDAAPRRIWGIPVVTVAGLPAKTGILLDRSAVGLYVDKQGIRTDWGSPADSWTKNEIVARTEGRFDLAVYQPAGVIKIGTAA